MQKFSYTPTNPFSGSLSSLAIGAGMVIVPLVYPFGIRIGRMPILGATATTIIFVVGGLALLTFTVREIMQARKLIAQGGEITVDGDLQRWLTEFVQERIDEGRKWDIRDGILSLGGELFKEKNKDALSVPRSREELGRIVSRLSLIHI